MTNNLILNFDEFLRSVEINKNGTFALLLGAGASVTSGIQSAYDCIWEWKTRIYFANNPNAPKHLENYKLDQVRLIIQKWLDSEGTYLPLDDPNEYSFYVEKCYPIEDDRRVFFQSICEKKIPSIGYKLICLLAEAGIIQSVWTTNFDNLTVKAGHITNTTVIDISLDSVDRIIRPVNRNEILQIGLHGDYRYGSLKNTDAELKTQDDTFRNRLIDYLTDKHLIVLGYSGRDTSLMEALLQAYSKRGAGRLFWCGRGRDINPKVAELLNLARGNSRTAFFVPIDGFDDTLISLSKSLLKENNESLEKINTYQAGDKKELINTPFSIQLPYFNSIIKSNSFPISLPQEAICFEMRFEEGESTWQTVRSFSEGFNLCAVPYKGLIWAFGTVAEIQKCFNERIIGKMTRQPLGSAPVHQDTAIYNLMLSSLTKALSQKSNLNSDGKCLIWLKGSQYNKKINSVNYSVHKAIRLSINFDTQHYITLLPDFKVVSGTDEKVPKEVLQEVGRGYFEKIYNKQFNDYVNDWRAILFKSENNPFNIEYPLNTASGFVFEIRKSPTFAKIMKSGSASGINIDYSKFPSALIRYSGIQYKEPELIFASPNPAMRSIQTDFHPMRGLLNNKPFDHYFNQNQVEGDISLTIICPEQDKEKFSSFINQQNQKISSYNINKDYLIDYKGFYETYKTSLNISNYDSDDWELLKEPQSLATIEETCLALARSISSAITSLRNKGKNSVILIYIPQRWNPFLNYSSDSEHFDLHDYIKAFAAPSGITTQFIQQETVESKLQCQIHWWLSLSFYVKSFRTPWILGDLDKQTAFAGIGYSIDHTVDSRNHIVIGCSHIYNSQGEGLKYKLSKVEEPIWDNQKNPHLSYNDAFKLGLSIKELFFSSMRELPKRVVIHKRTYFSNDEIKGIQDSLLSSGIEKIDLIEISFESNIKYVASKIIENAPREADSYPLPRGTTIVLNKFTALLWSHGVVPAVTNPNYRYYLGGRYIPSPLKIIKHSGDGNIGLIANEILGLSKMNWNSFDLYTQLPATITSSNEIARIGKQLSRIKGITYDYRCFM